MNRKLNVGVVGATGLVGEIFLKIMEERQFPLGQLRLFASDRSTGQSRTCRGVTAPVEALSEDSFRGLDVVFFSSGDDISKEWAPRAAADKAIVIDNSAAFRTDNDKLLMVPEVNGHLLPKPGAGLIIANPNCSTIQLVVALNPLLKTFDIESVHVASYQAVSGAGKAAHDEFRAQTEAWLKTSSAPAPQVFPHPIALNCIPQIGGFADNGFCSEEIKIMRETKKILGRPDIRVSAFTVRIPAWNAHSEAVWVRFKKSANRENLIKCFKTQPGLLIEDDPVNSVYPTALAYSGRDPVAVGRIHQDLDDPQTWMFWVVSDNLRKGAALNGVQIAERIFDITPAS